MKKTPNRPPSNKGGDARRPRKEGFGADFYKPQLGDPDKSARPPRPDGDRPSFNGPRPERSDRPSFDSRPPRRDGDSRPSFNGPRPERSDRPSFDSRPPRQDQKPKQNKSKSKNAGPPESDDMRLNRYVAHSGLCARRKADELIQSGKIMVNDVVVREPGHRVMPDDKVEHKGKILRPVSDFVYVLMNKPKDVITTSDDEGGRKTVLDLIAHKIPVRVYPVGRLDRNTTGLLLLTNDGELTQKLSHPSYLIKKIYHVVLDKPLVKQHFEAIEKGLTLDDGLAEVDSLSYVDGADKNELGIEIHIGKNRIVRRIFESLGYEVVKLDRVLYAGLTKKDIGRGHFRYLTPEEVVRLKHFNKKP